MRLAVLSDIHSNSVALAACLDYLEGHPADAVLLLGDYVSDCPDPQETLGLLRGLQEKSRVFMVRGNRENYFLSYRDGQAGPWGDTSYQGSLLYTYERLSGEDLDWFASMPETRLLTLPGTSPILMVHGSPVSARELMDRQNPNTDRHLDALEGPIMVAGHTHRQFVYERNGKTLLNPGSVGVAIGACSRAHMAELSWEGGRWAPRLLSIPYDYEKVREKFLGSSLMEKAKVWPACILKSILCGVNLGPICAKRAYDLAVAAGEEIQGQPVPEAYWEQAAREIGVYGPDEERDRRGRR